MRNILRSKVLFCFIILLLFLCPQRVEAQEPPADGPLISEVFYDTPGADATEEWVEIYNPTDTTQDLSGWILTDLSQDFIFPTPTQIEPGSFLTIAKNTTGFQNLYGFGPDLDSLNFSLNNSGDQVILKNSFNEVVDAVVYETGVWCPEPDFCVEPHPGVPTGYSIERVPANEDSDDCAMDFIDQKYPSPGTTPVILEEPIEVGADFVELAWSESLDANFNQYQVFISQDQDDLGDLVETVIVIDQTSFLIEDLQPGQTYYFVIKTITADELKTAISNQIEAVTIFEPIYSVIISELLPAPTTGSENEWIELYNTGSQVVNLSGWYLDDNPGGSSPYQIPAGSQILPGQYLVFYKTETKIALNDTGDQARLLWPNLEQAVACPTYSSAAKGQSWARNFAGSWEWTTSPTAGAKNIITQPETVSTDPISTNIAEARNLAKGSLVSVEGTVTAPPGLFSKYYFYIQDDTGGIQIYFSKAIFPALKVGDRVRVVGETSEYSGEKRIKVKDPAGIIIIGTADPPAPKKIKTGETKNYEGQLVQVSGRIVETSGSTFYIDDGSGKIRIYVSSKTGIKKPKMKKGDWVQIVGIVSRTKLGLRIMPRFQSDIVHRGGATSRKSTASSILGDVFGVQKALAAGPDLVLGQDFRAGQNKGAQALGWGLILGGLVLLATLFGFSFWRKRLKKI